MFHGYNTNGLAHHDLFDAVELLAEIGYRGVAITIDHNALPPGSPGHSEEIGRLRRLLEKLGMRSTIETGARFFLDPRVKHEPTLVSELSDDRRRRIEFYKHAIDCAAELGSDCVSLWSGAPQGGEETETVAVPKNSPSSPNAHPLQWVGADQERQPRLNRQMMERLVGGLCETLNYAAAKNVSIAFEPEPGMFIDTMRAFEKLLAHMEPGGADISARRADIPVCLQQPDTSGRQECLPSCSSGLRLTLDIGHLHCQGETPIADAIRRWASRLVNVHIEDMRAGRHEHLMFGEGEIDFPPVLRTLAEVGYTGGVFVELSRHSHEGPAAARRAFEFLGAMMSCG